MAQIQSMGYTKTYINNNNNIEEKEIKWFGNENDKNLNVHLAVNDNGRQEQMDVQLDKNDIMDLLKTQPISIPLTKRLQTDFLPNKNPRRRSMRHKSKQKHSQKAKSRTRSRSRTRTKYRNKFG